MFELSALLALDVLTSVPRGVTWLGRSARVAGRRTATVVSAALLDHYAETLAAIRRQGLTAWWGEQFRPYLAGAARQFSPRKSTWTERWLKPGARPSAGS